MKMEFGELTELWPKKWMRYTASRYVMCLGGLEYDQPKLLQSSERMPWAG